MKIILSAIFVLMSASVVLSGDDHGHGFNLLDLLNGLTIPSVSLGLGLDHIMVPIPLPQLKLHTGLIRKEIQHVEMPKIHKVQKHIVLKDDHHYDDHYDDHYRR